MRTTLAACGLVYALSRVTILHLGCADQARQACCEPLVNVRALGLAEAALSKVEKPCTGAVASRNTD